MERIGCPVVFMWSLEEQGLSQGPLFPSTAEELIDAANTPD